MGVAGCNPGQGTSRLRRRVRSQPSQAGQPSTRGEAAARSALGEGQKKVAFSPGTPHPPTQTSSASPQRGEARISAPANTLKRLPSQDFHLNACGACRPSGPTCPPYHTLGLRPRPRRQRSVARGRAKRAGWWVAGRGRRFGEAARSAGAAGGVAGAECAANPPRVSITIN